MEMVQGQQILMYYSEMPAGTKLSQSASICNNSHHKVMQCTCMCMWVEYKYTD